MPLPSPYDRIWLGVEKVTDVFHFPNHTSPQCRELYSPAQLKADNPNFNTQAGEQTFTWIGRFMHIVFAMNKTHHLFYLHHVVLRRNNFMTEHALNTMIIARSKNNLINIAGS